MQGNQHGEHHKSRKNKVARKEAKKGSLLQENIINYITT